MSSQRLQKILFMRHGIAVDRDEFVGEDDKRPLTDKGVKKVAMVARKMADLFVPDVIVSSDLVRAQETAAICRDALLRERGDLVPMHVLKGQNNILRPESHPQEWIAFFAAEPRLQMASTVLVVGHEPNLSGVLQMVTKGQAKITKFKKAGLAVLEPDAPGSHWHLKAYWAPKDWN
jgi:phosphohistidine phosphatase